MIDNALQPTAPTVSNQFSWHRVWSIASMYQPAIKWQIVIYTAISFATGFLAYFLSANLLGVLAYGMLGFVTGFLAYFGSLVFARRSNMIVETMLPATGAEKSVFYIGYSLIIIPIALYLPYYAVMFIGNWIHPIVGEFSEILDMQNKMTVESYGLNLMQSLLPMAVCLYVVMASTKNRIVKAVAWTIGVNILMGLVGMIYGIVVALSGKFTPDEDSAYNMGIAIGENMSVLIMICGAASLAISLVFVWLTYRKISTRQL